MDLEIKRLKHVKNPRRWKDNFYFCVHPACKESTGLPYNIWIGEDRNGYNGFNAPSLKDANYANYCLIIQLDKNKSPDINNSLLVRVYKDGKLAINEHLNKKEHLFLATEGELIKYLLSLHVVFEVLSNPRFDSVLSIDIEEFISEDYSEWVKNHS